MTAVDLAQGQVFNARAHVALDGGQDGFVFGGQQIKFRQGGELRTCLGCDAVP